MSSVDCSLFTSNAGCDIAVCFTDWSIKNSASILGGTYCQPLPGEYAICGTLCGVTKWGNDCCVADDWQTCFINLAKKGCPGGESVDSTYALVPTVTGSALQGTSAATASSGTSTSSRTSGTQTTGSPTTSSSPTTTSSSSAERSTGRRFQLAAYALVASFLVNTIA